MGCVGDSALIVINKKREFPPPIYNIINLDLNAYNPKPFQNIDADLCQEYCIGPLFNSCSSIYGIEKSKNIFYSTFKDKIKEINKKMIELTDYEKFIDFKFLDEYIWENTIIFRF